MATSSLWALDASAGGIGLRHTRWRHLHEVRDALACARNYSPDHHALVLAALRVLMKIAIAALLQYGPLLGLLAIYAASIVLAGLLLLNVIRFKSTGAGPVECIGLAFVLGQGLIGTLWQVLASVSLFSRWAVLGSLLLVAAGGIVVFRRDGCTWISLMPRLRSPVLLAAMVVTASSVILMVLNFPLSLLPPGTDAMAFYIAQPKLIAALGSFAPLPQYQALAQIGLAAEMHYGAFFLIGGDHLGELAGKAFVWFTGVASLVVLSGVSRQAGLSRMGCAITVAAAVSCTAFTLVLWDGKTDLLPNSLALAAVYGVLLRTSNPARPAVTGLAAGMASVGKLSFIPSFGLTLAILFLRQGFLQPNWHTRLTRDAAHMAAWFLVPVLALVLKNALGYGEPFAPFFMLNTGPAAQLDQVWFSPENTRWIVSTYPLALTFGQYPMQHGNIGVPILAALPFLLVPALRREAGTTAIWLALAGIAGVIAWVVLRPSVLAPRYILPCLFLLIPACATILEWMWNEGGRMARSAIAAAALMLFYIQAVDAHAMILNNRYYLLALPKMSTHPIWQTADAANKSDRSAVRVLNLMYYSSMYRPDCDRDGQDGDRCRRRGALDLCGQQAG